MKCFPAHGGAPSAQFASRTIGRTQPEADVGVLLRLRKAAIRSRTNRITHYGHSVTSALVSLGRGLLSSSDMMTAP